MDKDRIGIVTVLYKSSDVLDGFYESLDSQTYRNFVLYAIDNKSPDDSLHKIRMLAQKASFQTVIIEAEDNGGVAKGNNIGIEKALADGCGMVLLANNDIEFAPDTISGLLESMRAHGCDMAVPKIFNYFTGKLWYAGGGYGYKSPTYHSGIYRDDAPEYNIAGCVEYAPTCFMLIDSDVFDKVGMIDERYFAYFDDTDFIWRAVRINALKLWYEPQCVVQHKIGNASGNKPSVFGFYLTTRNRAYFMSKYFPWYRRLCVNAFQFTHSFLYSLKHPEFPGLFKEISIYREGKKMYRDSLSDNK